jgi:hypothetical protein
MLNAIIKKVSSDTVSDLTGLKGISLSVKFEMFFVIEETQSSQVVISANLVPSGLAENTSKKRISA